MYVFFDTETTGIPRNWRAPVTDLSNWPRIVQLAWAEYGDDGAPVAEGGVIVRPDGFTIPADAARVHGITTERATREGVPLADALSAFATACGRHATGVAHNLKFDENVLGAEFLRARLANPLPRLTRMCTMEASTSWCRLPGPRGFKWPTLDELHGKLFGAPPERSHDAVADTRACARCFFELKRLGVIR